MPDFKSPVPTFTLYDVTTPHRRTLVKAFDTFEAAEAYAREQFVISYYEADEDHPGCADMLVNWGGLYSIERTPRLVCSRGPALPPQGPIVDYGQRIGPTLEERS